MVAWATGGNRARGREGRRRAQVGAVGDADQGVDGGGPLVAGAGEDPVLGSDGEAAYSLNSSLTMQ
jgi:hypothetical protein